MKKQLALVLALMACSQAALAQRDSMDMRKAIVEFPTAKLLKQTDPQPLATAPSIPPPRPLDVRKAAIEVPTARLLKATTTTTAPTEAKVKPGLVRWHQDFDAALVAARQSGKPVLLLQLMGKLDDEFC